MKTKFSVYLVFIVLLIFQLTFSCKKDSDDPKKVPTLTIADATSITSTTASCVGTISSDGGSAVTARGVCWNTTQNPTIADSKTTNGTGKGSFTGEISGLTPGETYYVRAYATNGIGTAYSNQIDFSTTAIAPSLTTTVITAIAATTASGGGNITNDGGAAIAARGVCWSTSHEPTTADPKTTDNSGTGSFTSSLSELTTGTTYFVRAYATNSIGTSYGNEVTFKTTAAPTLTTSDATLITSNGATCGGDITDDGGADVTVSGVCWSIATSPTIDDSKTTDGSASGVFTSTITDLTASTTYYVRAYATNSVGTSYGNEIELTTTAETVTDKDGNVYQTVTIGTQLWMAENLRTTQYADGTPITLVNTVSDWNALTVTSEAYCYYNDDPTTYASTYGALYTWSAAMRSAASSNTNPSNVQGVCPDSWHLPSDAEWHAMVLIMDPSAVLSLTESSSAGGKMKEAGTLHWVANTDGSNLSGFTALPGGRRMETGAFTQLTYNAMWWTSTEDGIYAKDRTLYYNSGRIDRAPAYRNVGYSVRCVKN